MANVTVSFNEKNPKERALREWIDSRGGKTATNIKDLLNEYKTLLETVEMLERIAATTGTARVLLESVKEKPEASTKDQDEGKRPEATESPPPPPKKIKKRKAPSQLW
jgi:hypothetical protein